MSASDVKLPRSDAGFQFAVLGDTGTGGREQIEVGNLPPLEELLEHAVDDPAA